MNQPPKSTQPDPADPDQLIRLHLPLAYRLAACYRGFGKSYEDLVRTASVGLLTAAGRFDPARGSAFRAFATPIITAQLRRSLGERDAGLARSGRRLADGRTRQINRSQRRIAAALARGARVNDLARLLSVDGQVMADALLSAAAREAVTLNLPAQRHGERSHLACLAHRAA
jgi:RNA polymerase sigma-B factor